MYNLVFGPLLRHKIVTEGHHLLRLSTNHTFTNNFKQYVVKSSQNRYLHVTYSLSEAKQSKSSELATSSKDANVSTTVYTVKETVKTTSYLGVIILGVTVTGALFYAIFRELFSSKSPNSVYTKALDRCMSDNRIIDLLGEPIQGFGEETRRGRRRHVSHLLYEKDGVNFLRMKFYVKGSRRQATVNLEMKENAQGKFEYRYLFVQLDDSPYLSIILEDNRAQDSGRIDTGLVPLSDVNLSA